MLIVSPLADVRTITYLASVSDCWKRTLDKRYYNFMLESRNSASSNSQLLTLAETAKQRWAICSEKRRRQYRAPI